LEPGDLQEIQKISSPHPIMDLLSDHLEDASVLQAPPIVTTAQGHGRDPFDQSFQGVLVEEVGREELDKKVSDDISARLKIEKDAAPIVLNAKISKVEDTGNGATAAWRAISTGVTGNSTTANIKKEEHLRDGVICDGSSLPLDAEGRLPFFLIDAHEEPYEANPGTIYMFGKVCVHA
jgi:DNA polymerase alpha subunit A